MRPFELERVPRDVVAPGIAHETQCRQMGVLGRYHLARKVIADMPCVGNEFEQTLVDECPARFVQMQKYEPGGDDHPFAATPAGWVSLTRRSTSGRGTPRLRSPRISKANNSGLGKKSQIRWVRACVGCAFQTPCSALLFNTHISPASIE